MEPTVNHLKLSSSWIISMWQQKQPKHWTKAAGVQTQATESKFPRGPFCPAALAEQDVTKQVSNLSALLMALHVASFGSETWTRAYFAVIIWTRCRTCKSSGLVQIPKQDYAVKICFFQSLNEKNQRAPRSCMSIQVQKCGHVTPMALSLFNDHLARKKHLPRNCGCNTK